MTTGYRSDIQFLRGIAVLAVILYHADFGVSGGFVGVDVFFVISGYLVARSLSMQPDIGRVSSLRRFVVRRVKRLWPALALMVAVVSVFSAIFLSPFEDQAPASKVGIGSLFGVANLVLMGSPNGYFSPSQESNPFLHTWSLSVEEQLYLLLACLWLWLTVNDQTVSRRRNLVLLVACFLGSLGSLIAVRSFGEASEDLAWAYYFPIFRLWEVVAGAICYQLQSDESRVGRGFRRAAVSAGFCLVLVSFFIQWDRSAWPGVHSLLPVVGVMTILLFRVAVSRGRLQSAWRLGVWLGDRSYSVYLWHWPLLAIGSQVLPTNFGYRVGLLALGVLLAHLSYELVEYRFKAATSYSTRLRVYFSVLLGAALGCSTFLGFGARNVWWIDWSNASKFETRVAYECVDKPLDLGPCTLNGQGSDRGLVLLVGDSQAYTYGEGLLEAVEAERFGLVISSRSGCPFLPIPTTGGHPLDCERWQVEMIELAKSGRFQAIVIANRAAGYINEGWRSFVVAESSISRTTSALAQYRISLRKLMAALEPEGVPVLLIQGIPEPEPLSVGFSLFKRWTSTASTSFPAEQTYANREPVREVEAEVVRDFEDVYLLDPFTLLCFSGSCALKLEGGEVYEDNWHISALGSRLFTRTFASFLSGVVP